GPGRHVVPLGGMMAVTFYADWAFPLLRLSVAAVVFVVVYFYTLRIKKASRAVRKKESELLSGLAEVLSAIHVVQAFARENYEERRFEGESRQSVEAGLSARSTKAELSPIVEL